MYLPAYEDLYNILMEAHTRTGHGGRNKMEKGLANIDVPRPAIVSFIASCEGCKLKKPKHRNKLVVKPIISTDFQSRCQCDLVDMSSEADGEYK